MTAQRIDRYLLGLGALLILISSYQLFFKVSATQAGAKLATLTSTLSVVKTKNALSLDWRDASSGNDLSENQLIYTDSSSSAEVKFDSGSLLEVGENSLIKLTALGNEEGMDLSQGFIRAKIQDGKPLKVQMNGEDFVLTGSNADVQINMQDEKGEIGVLAGEVKVQSQGKEENLNPKNALEISKNSMSKKAIVFEVMNPSKGEVIYTASSKVSVHFEWDPEKSGKVLISKRASMENSFEVSKKAELSPGLYYFRIESETGTSLVQSFKVLKEIAPVQLRPLQGEKVSVLDDSDPQILLQWEDKQRNNYILEWNDGEIHQQEISGGSALIAIQKSGILSWRLKIQNEKRPLAQWSNWQEVRVELIALPETPIELSPNDIEFQTYETPNEKLELTWKGAKSAIIELKTPDQEMTEISVLNESYEYLAKQAGEYQWRIKSIDSYQRESQWSEWQKFKILDLSSETTSEGIQTIQLERPDQSVTFEWKKENEATTVFELSKDPQFKTIVKKVEGKKDSVQVNIPEVGAYYWRSREFRADGTYQVSRPKKVIIEPVPAPMKPESLPNMEVPLIEAPVRSSLIRNIFNLLISTAHADGIKGTIKIELPVKEEAKGYIVKIFQDKELTKLVFEKEVDSKSFEWKGATAGEYYWQYAVIDFWDRKSLFSDPSHLVVKMEDVPLPQKPRLLFPIRAKEIEKKDLVLKWRGESTQKFKIEISSEKKFKKILLSQEIKKNELELPKNNLTPGLYYWRVHSFNKRREETLSNTGRFTILPPREKKLIIDKPAPKVWQKTWKKRAFLAWAPSMDSYTFKDGASGKIDGNLMQSAQLSGTYFYKDYAFNGEILRQSGEVFEGESYLFSRLMVDGLKAWDLNPRHKIAVGLGLAQSSGDAYKISNGNVSSVSVSGLNYGPVFRNYYAINKTWELQGRAMYLLGEITQIELGADAIYHYKNFLLLGGVGYASRDYEISSGSQSSTKLSLGFGKEF